MGTETSTNTGGGTATPGSAAPTVFVSYRIDDTADVVDGLAPGLRDDVGAHNVFRDRDSLIGGQPWQQRIDDSIRSADMTLFIVGNHWVGSGDGGRRIDDIDDPVRREIEIALASDNATIPVLVDLEGPPADLDDTIARLFEAHAIRATRAGLADAESEDYQAVLVSVWEALRHRVPGGVLVLTDTEAQVDLDALVAELNSSKLVDARKLSRLAAGVHVVPGRRIQRWAKRLPDVIVIADDTPSPTLQARIAAITRHPQLQRVAFLGAGVAAGLGVAAASSVGGGSVALTAHTSAGELGAMTTGPVRQAASSSVSRLVGAGVATKAAVATCVVAVGAVGAATVLDDSDITVGATVRYGYLDVTLDDVETFDPPSEEGEADEGDVPADTSEAEQIRAAVGISPDDLESDDQLVVVDVTIDETSDAIDWRIDTAEVFHLEVADELYHVAGNRPVELAASRDEQLAMGFVVPAAVDVGTARLVVQERPRDTDLRTRPAYLQFDGSTSTNVHDREITDASYDFSALGTCLAHLTITSILVGDDAGFRDNGGPVWNNTDRLARPLDGRVFVTVIGTASRERTGICAAGDQSWVPPYLIGVDGSPRDAVSAHASETRSWTLEPRPWIWTFEADESLEVFDFVVPKFEGVTFSASLAEG